MERKTIDLETFLESLPEEDAANARAAAARIDELERTAQRIGKSDRRYVILFAGAVLLALAAAVMALGGYDLFSSGNAGYGDMAVLVMAGALPLLVLIYSLRMRERTKIDRQKFQIIETCFMPYDGIYFPPGPEREKGMVSISPGAKAWRKPNTKDVKKAQMYW
ncbi:MAG: hypothetical protein ACE5FM_03090 [Methyloligellaceae bacterium]